LPLPGSPLVFFVDGTMRVSWNAIDGVRLVTYDVNRVHLDASGKQSVVHVGSTARTEMTDSGATTLASGDDGTVWWEITARSGARRSNQARTAPWTGLPDVSDVRAASSPSGVTLTWRLPAEAGDAEVIIERRVVSSGDGPLRRHRVRGRRWKDTDARSGSTYSYLVRLEHLDRGRVARTPGVEVTVAVGKQPSDPGTSDDAERVVLGPVEDLRIDDTGTALRLRFEFPQGAQDALLLWRRDRLPVTAADNEGGRPVTVEELRRDGGCLIAAPHDGRPWYVAVVPVVMADGEAVFGPLATATAREGTGTRVRWDVRPADESGRVVLLDVETGGASPTLRLLAAPEAGGDGVVLLELPAASGAGRVRGVRVDVDAHLLPAVLTLVAEPADAELLFDEPPLADRTLPGRD
jgi:hypothetical protein